MSRENVRQCYYLVLAALAAVGSVFGQSLLVAAPAEQPNCTTNVCKNIKYFYQCSLKTGYMYVSDDCLSCRTASGRCNTTSTVACTKRDPITQEAGVVSVTEHCDCAKIGDGGQAHLKAVEAGSTAIASSTGDTGRKLYTCD